MQRRMIDQGETRRFDRYCRALIAGRHGDSSVEAQLLARGRAATAHMDKMLASMTEIRLAIEEMAGDFNDIDLKFLRRDKFITNEFFDKFVKTVMQVSVVLFTKHPYVIKFPSSRELPYTFIFRLVVCMLLSARIWISVGGAGKAKPEKLRNDMVDTFFAAYATYFDGLFTCDRKLIEIYEEASLLIQEFIDVIRARSSDRPPLSPP